MLQLKGGVTHASPFYFASIADFFDDFFLCAVHPVPICPLRASFDAHVTLQTPRSHLGKN